MKFGNKITLITILVLTECPLPAKAGLFDCLTGRFKRTQFLKQLQNDYPQREIPVERLEGFTPEGITQGEMEGAWSGGFFGDSERAKPTYRMKRTLNSEQELLHLAIGPSGFSLYIDGSTLPAAQAHALHMQTKGRANVLPPADPNSFTVTCSETNTPGQYTIRFQFEGNPLSLQNHVKQLGKIYPAD